MRPANAQRNSHEPYRFNNRDTVRYQRGSAVPIDRSHVINKIVIGDAGHICL
jgi:hypothetical protein